jgi:hypothetical protein
VGRSREVASNREQVRREREGWFMGREKKGEEGRVKAELKVEG